MSRDTISSSKEADAFLRAKDYHADFEKQLIPALQILSSTPASRDSMPLYCAWALDYYAWDILDAGWLDIARQLFDKALSYCPASDSATFYAIRSGLAYIDLQKGHHNRARKTLEEVTAFHRRVNDLDFLAKDLSSMGAYYYHTDNKAEARKMYNKALEVCNSSGNAELKCFLMLCICNIFGTFEERDSMLQEL